MRQTDMKDVWSSYKKTGDEKAREQLVLAYSPLVKFVAGRMSSGLPAHIEESDLISYGLLGLIGAIERFDPQREIKFETFAVSRIKVSAAAFRLRRPFAAIDADNVFRITGEQVNYGVEASWSGRMTRSLILYGGMTALDPTLRCPPFSPAASQLRRRPYAALWRTCWIARPFWSPPS